MAYTAAQMADAVLVHLVIVGQGQTASAADTTLVTNAYNSLYERLRTKGLAPWASGAVEEQAYGPLTAYLASKVAIKFGFTGARLAGIKAEGREGYQELREQAAGYRHPVPIVARYY